MCVGDEKFVSTYRAGCRRLCHLQSIDTAAVLVLMVILVDGDRDSIDDG